MNGFAQELSVNFKYNACSALANTASLSEAYCEIWDESGISNFATWILKIAVKTLNILELWLPRIEQISFYK